MVLLVKDMARVVIEYAISHISAFSLSGDFPG
jgi:hypothetical protein